MFVKEKNKASLFQRLRRCGFGDEQDLWSVHPLSCTTEQLRITTKTICAVLLSHSRALLTF